MSPTSFADAYHLERCARCTELQDRSQMVHGSEIKPQGRGWYCGRHARALGYRGPKLALWGL